MVGLLVSPFIPIPSLIPNNFSVANLLTPLLGTLNKKITQPNLTYVFVICKKYVVK